MHVKLLTKFYVVTLLIFEGRLDFGFGRMRIFPVPVVMGGTRYGLPAKLLEVARWDHWYQWAVAGCRPMLL
jgi:hypothetical protein